MEPAEAVDGNEEGDTKVKRKMKTPAQIQSLELAFSHEPFPSEELRAELSAKLGLTDRQLQMWFSRRRLKDRSGGSSKRRKKDSVMIVGSNVVLEGMSVSTEAIGPRVGGNVSVQAIALVEAQLGQPLREDGPVFGTEFDSMPPGAFGAPIVGMTTMGQKNQAERPYYDGKQCGRPDAELLKDTTRTVHEYQFIPEQPTVRTCANERATPSHNCDSISDGLSSKMPLHPGHIYIHGNEQATSGYGFQGQMPSLNVLPQGGQTHDLPCLIAGMDARFIHHPSTILETSPVPSERRALYDEDSLGVIRKKKSEEARIAREVEAYEKRIRRELEKQEMLRQKREEQIRKEMERQDRERRKEEERLWREKQREEEKYLREQRREMERKERFLQKEYIKAEKLRQKEELRRVKEAAKIKAANERAIARRTAKESVELVDDERLELMELAASTKGLSSILSLDYETLQNLDFYRDKLSVFPPISVQLKRPITIEPWSGSDENLGNLLMVWKFLVTFGDVLGLWPFTLDEFILALHDYDARLLCEIHVALLRSIINDIEDVARTPSTGLAANHNSIVNPGGGHPHIVEGAYAWGFDIRNWQRHLGPLTWPEILRQLALSAGFGPQLKNLVSEGAYCRDDNKANDGDDIISRIRNGEAAENAVAIMRERGYTNPRKSRHLLTPGTVKFAAYHVLSLEGNKGLSILEIAEKIQKSGLRDLRTSKTPEASISAALSRDTKLFERTAPSTYCVRSPYRKDPADAEAILAAAKDRIRTFKSGTLQGQEVEDAERDEEVDTDQNSESDVAEDPDADYLANVPHLKKEAPDRDKVVLNTEGYTMNKNCSSEIVVNSEGCPAKVDEMSAAQPNVFIQTTKSSAEVDQSDNVAKIANETTHVDQEERVIDDSNLGEHWVQGLADGEYSDLSVEERLNALVALIGVANEGNSIRVVLEERIEAAHVLKKQMLAEAQLDKRRTKEDFLMRMQYSTYAGSKAEPSFSMSLAECRRSTFVMGDDKNKEILADTAVQQECSSNPQNYHDYPNNVSSEGNSQIHEIFSGHYSFSPQQQSYVSETSRKQLKSYISHKAEEMYVYRSLPLGQDRRRNRYWCFSTSASQNDPGSGRIFVEMQDGCWRLIDSEEGFDALLASLDARGVRESELQLMLRKIEFSFRGTVRKNALSAHMIQPSDDRVKPETEETSRPICGVGVEGHNSDVCPPESVLLPATSLSFRVELGWNEKEEDNAYKRYWDFETWMWKECLDSKKLCAMKLGKERSVQLLSICDNCLSSYYFAERQCPHCRASCNSNGNLKSFNHDTENIEKLKVNTDSRPPGSVSSPLQTRLLKAQLALIEASVLPVALKPFWIESSREAWGMKMQSSSSAEELLQMLTLLENAIKRDYISSNFETTGELMGSCTPPGLAFNHPSLPEIVPVLPWIPYTRAAVALRLLDLDSSIFYTPEHKFESQKNKEAESFLTDYIATKKAGAESVETPHLAENHQECKIDRGLAITSLEYVRRGRPRGRPRTHGGRNQKRISGSKPQPNKMKQAAVSETLGVLANWRAQTDGKTGHRRGPRSARSRRKPTRNAVEAAGGKDASKDINYLESQTALLTKWNEENGMGSQMAAEKASSSSRSEYGEDNGEAPGDEYKMASQYCDSPYTAKAENLLEGSDINVYSEDSDDVENYEGDNPGKDQGEMGVKDEDEGFRTTVNTRDIDDGGRLSFSDNNHSK